MFAKSYSKRIIKFSTGHSLINRGVTCYGKKPTGICFIVFLPKFLRLKLPVRLFIKSISRRVDVSMNNLLLRDKKQLYRKALNGEEDPVVGVDIEFIKPEQPNIVIDNNMPRESLAELAQVVVDDIERVNK